MSAQEAKTPHELRVAMLEDPLLEDAAPEAVHTCRAMLNAFGSLCSVETRPSPVSMGRLVDLLRSVMLHEMARIYRDVLDTPDLVGPRFLEGVREGLAISLERCPVQRGSNCCRASEDPRHR